MTNSSTENYKMREEELMTNPKTWGEKKATPGLLDEHHLIFYNHPSSSWTPCNLSI